MNFDKLTPEELWIVMNDCAVALMEKEYPMDAGEFRDIQDVYYISLRYIEEDE